MKPFAQNDRGKTKTRVSLRVAKQMGETGLQFLAQLDLLDRDSNVKHNDEMLSLPLRREPSSEENERLRSRLGMLTIGQEEFESKAKNVKTLDKILDGRLPPRLIASLPSSFDIIGDIAVVELSPELSGNESSVADAIMSVHRNLKAVFAKAGAVSGSDRIRPLRHLAGENRTTTVHKEFGCVFKLDIAKTYFSPRLSTEHQRVSRLVQPGERVVDMFAGVGPFSILIARALRDVNVDAVDSNPEAVKFIEDNVRLNKVKGNVRVWAGDARDIVRENLTGTASRVIMNLPSAAREFVDAACQALQSDGGVLHYYTFADGLAYENKAVGELERALATCSWRIAGETRARAVRGVAPMQWQVVVDARVAPIS